MTETEDKGPVIACCGTCAFARFTNSPGNGICKRFPPQVVMTSFKDYHGFDRQEQSNLVPTVAFDWWCGEYKLDRKYEG